MQKNKLFNALAPIIIIAGFLSPLTIWEIREGILFIYKSISNGMIFNMIDVNGMINSLQSVANKCVCVVVISLVALIIRAIAGIETSLKKTLFAFGTVFYLIPFQVLLIIIVLSIFQNFSAIEWNTSRVWATSVYTASLGMSLWIYRILVSRKNTLFKTTLAVFANALLVFASFLPIFFSTSWSFILAITFVFAWLATVADITFEGFGYKLVAKIFGR